MEFSFAFGDEYKFCSEGTPQRHSSHYTLHTPNSKQKIGGKFTSYFCLDYTDIQLKTLSRRVKVFNMKIIMRRDFMIF